MKKRVKILSGIVALVIGMSVAIPIRASADRDDNYPYRHHHHSWRWQQDNDHYRAYPYAPAYSDDQRGSFRSNGEGMVNRRNPNLYWACDSDGHHCHWAPR